MRELFKESEEIKRGLLFKLVLVLICEVEHEEEARLVEDGHWTAALVFWKSKRLQMKIMRIWE